jgi:hypothetical protein
MRFSVLCVATLVVLFGARIQAADLSIESCLSDLPDTLVCTFPSEPRSPVGGEIPSWRATLSKSDLISGAVADKDVEGYYNYDLTHTAGFKAANLKRHIKGATLEFRCHDTANPQYRRELDYYVTRYFLNSLDAVDLSSGGMIPAGSCVAP